MQPKNYYIVLIGRNLFKNMTENLLNPDIIAPSTYSLTQPDNFGCSKTIN